MPKTYTQIQAENPAPSLDGTEKFALDKGESTVGATTQQVVDLAKSQQIAFAPLTAPPTLTEGLLWVVTE